ncbi:MAG: hypothetical protein LBE79_08965 [Tannerella sp.]|jgi:hypothetical protein|nr:hypothetical protein [Tannerella sp.]
MNRRDFLQSTLASVALTIIPSERLFAESLQDHKLPSRIKISLNAYSFNRLLTSGEMTMDDMLEIIINAGYRGYLPIETLGGGDPGQKIAVMYEEVKKRFPTN